MLTRFNFENEQFKIISEISLFNVNCAFIQFERLNYTSKLELKKIDKLNTSKILFYATTSGSCGDVKPIGVTYKCFQPNITSLGYVHVFFISFFHQNP